MRKRIMLLLTLTMVGVAIGINMAITNAVQHPHNVTLFIQQMLHEKGDYMIYSKCNKYRVLLLTVT